MGAYWGAGTLVAADGKTVQIPDAWKAAWKYFYDGIWKDHFEHDRAESSAARTSTPRTTRSSPARSR